MNKPGIYKILNKVNRKYYIGSAVNLRVRKNLHFSKLNKHQHENLYLQRSWIKYGAEAFDFIILEAFDVKDKELMLSREQFWMDIHNATNKILGYNICEIARSRLGVKLSDKTKLKISQVQIGKRVSKETKELLLSYAARPKSEETKTRIRNSVKNNWDKRRSPIILTEPPIML